MPAAQPVQLAAPEAADVPGAHAVEQLVAPLLGWKRPALQLVHAADRTPAKAPAGQAAHAGAPAALWVPAAQLAQAAAPVLAWKVPAPHGVQASGATTLTATAKWPAKHAAQACPAAVWK